MSGKKLNKCDCMTVEDAQIYHGSWHWVGNELECDRCRAIRLNPELHRQVHPIDFTSRFYDGEQWADAEDRGREYQRIYNMTVRRERTARLLTQPAAGASRRLLDLRDSL